MMSGNLLLFILAVIVLVFTLLSIGHWVNAHAATQRARERFALLRKVAEQPPESARLVVDLLRDEDAKNERARAEKARREGLQGGAILMAVGLGISVMLWAVAAGSGAWTAGIMLMLMGIVLLAFNFFTTPPKVSTE